MERDLQLNNWILSYKKKNLLRTYPCFIREFQIFKGRLFRVTSAQKSRRT
jgi:hypothetical protein